MAFSSSISGQSIIGNLRFRWGTYTNAAADTGGDITTGLNAIFGFSLIPTSDVDCVMPKYSASGGTVTIDVPHGTDGNWFAVGV